MVVNALKPKTVVDWLALPEGARFELIDGELIEKAAPTFQHSSAQLGTGSALRGAFHGRGGGRGPGGWWLAAEVDVRMGERIFHPDLVGWRRELVPEPPHERPTTIIPGWIGEIVSESNRTTDTIVKVEAYHRAGVQHYWILDQFERSLTVYRHTVDGYLVALRADATKRVRAEPFEAIELSVAALLGDDVDD